METFEINGISYQVKRAKLKLWIELGQIQQHIKQAVESKDADKLSDNLCLYISTACSISIEELEKANWVEVFYAYSIVVFENRIEKIYPFMKYDLKENIKRPWDYDERTWYLYAHYLAKEYGWTLEYIAKLDVDDAFAIIQEIIVDEQLEREWQWTQSRNSFSYNESTKKYEFIPLKRPPWMQEIPKEPKKVLIPKALLPVGNVVRWNQDVVH